MTNKTTRTVIKVQERRYFTDDNETKWQVGYRPAGAWEVHRHIMVQHPVTSLLQ